MRKNVGNCDAIKLYNKKDTKEKECEAWHIDFMNKLKSMRYNKICKDAEELKEEAINIKQWIRTGILPSTWINGKNGWKITTVKTKQ